jgi:AcrR family transcriptional regulator
MIRTIPADRFAAVVAAAARVFIAHGYQRAQIQDVADALGLGKGTLYGYASSKAALFAAAVRYADGQEPLPRPGELPVPTPADGEIAAIVATRLAGEIADLTLIQVLATPAPADLTAADGNAELYQRLAKHRFAIKLVDRCAPEIPELAELWFGVGRRAQVSAVEQYLNRRANTVALPGPAPLLARTVVELCALWAVHCHFDPAPAPPGTPVVDRIDDTAVAAMLADVVVRATAASWRQPESPL